jgi:hypothetical protein
MVTPRRTYVSLAELPSDDRTLRQAKSLVEYKHPGARRLRARWNDPMDKSHGVTVEWEEQ